MSTPHTSPLTHNTHTHTHTEDVDFNFSLHSRLKLLKYLMTQTVRVLFFQTTLSVKFSQGNFVNASARIIIKLSNLDI